MLREIGDLDVNQFPSIDYSSYVEFIGTAHFTRTSIRDVLSAVKQEKYTAVCIELDKYRYDRLKNRCRFCSKWSSCDRKCEFVTATEALGNQDADIWLIDMTEREINHRISTLATYPEICAWNGIRNRVLYGQIQGLKLWEEGLKDEAMDYFQGNLQVMKETFPSLFRILITERNVLMACHLICIISRYLKQLPSEKLRILALTGAAHVDGIKKLLKSPNETLHLLKKLQIPFSPPIQIRRIKVN